MREHGPLYTSVPFALFDDQCARCAPAGRKTHVVTITNDNHVSAETVAIFLYRGYLRRTLKDNGSGALGCGGASEMPMSCCMCGPTETPQSLWRYTAKVGTRAQDTHRVVRRWVASLAHRLVLGQAHGQKST